MSDNRRQFTRINFIASADIIVNGKNYTTKILDMSMRGMLVESADIEFTKGESCEVIVSVPEHGSNTELEFIGTMAHIKNKGIGITISETDIDSFSALLDIMAKITGDAKGIQNEIINSLDNESIS